MRNVPRFVGMIFAAALALPARAHSSLTADQKR